MMTPLVPRTWRSCCCRVRFHAFSHDSVWPSSILVYLGITVATGHVTHHRHARHKELHIFAEGSAASKLLFTCSFFGPAWRPRPRGDLAGPRFHRHAGRQRPQRAAGAQPRAQRAQRPARLRARPGSAELMASRVSQDPLVQLLELR